jgi:hypothetical protein
LLIVLNHGHWLMLNIGRFSIDECLKDEQFVDKTRLIVTLLRCCVTLLATLFVSAIIA